MIFNNLNTSIIFALGALALFIFSAKLLSTTMKNIGDLKFKNILKNITKNRFIALIFGVVFTTIIQSSDGAMALIIGLLAAGFIDLRGAIAFLLGANIGTATTSLLVSFQSELAFTEYFVFFTFIGVFGYMLIKREKLSNVFLILFAIGAIFFSLKVLSSAAKYISNIEVFKNFVQNVIGANPWGAFSFSVVFTGIMQSSSATVTLYQILYGEGAIALPSAIALVFGSNVGTTVTGLILAFTSKNENSKKIALIWGITNLSISLLLLPFLYPLTYYADFILLLSPGVKTLQLSFAHLLFNFILVGIYIWLIDQIIWLVSKIIKTQSIPEKYNFKLPEELLHQNSFLALEAARNATYSFGKMSYEGIKIMEQFLLNGDEKVLEEFKNLGTIVEESRAKLYSYLVKVSSDGLANNEAQTHMALVLASRSINKIMSIGEEINNELLKIKDNKSETNFIISDDVIAEIKELVGLIKIQLKTSLKQISSFNKENNKLIEKMALNIDALSFEFAKANVSKLKEEIGLKQLELDFDYSRVLRALERINHHSLRINHYMKNSTFKVKRLSKDEQKTLDTIDVS